MPDSTNTHLADEQTLSDGAPGGTVIGASTSDKINLYGALTPIAQQTATAAGTDATTTQALANGIRTALINIGMWA